MIRRAILKLFGSEMSVLRSQPANTLAASIRTSQYTPSSVRMSRTSERRRRVGDLKCSIDSRAISLNLQLCRYRKSLISPSWSSSNSPACANSASCSGMCPHSRRLPKMSPFTAILLQQNVAIDDHLLAHLSAENQHVSPPCRWNRIGKSVLLSVGGANQDVQTPCRVSQSRGTPLVVHAWRNPWTLCGHRRGVTIESHGRTSWRLSMQVDTVSGGRQAIERGSLHGPEKCSV